MAARAVKRENCEMGASHDASEQKATRARATADNSARGRAALRQLAALLGQHEARRFLAEVDAGAKNARKEDRKVSAPPQHQHETEKL